MELWTAILAGCVYTVNNEGVKMRIGIQGVSGTLHERHGSALRRAEVQQFAGTTAQLAEQSPNEDIQNITGKARIVGHPVKQGKWQRQYPLTHGHHRKYTMAGNDGAEVLGVAAAAMTCIEFRP